MSTLSIKPTFPCPSGRVRAVHHTGPRKPKWKAERLWFKFCMWLKALGCIMKDLTFQIFQQLLKTALFKCVPGWITEIANNNSELKPVFLRLLNIGRSLLGKNPWRQIIEIKSGLIVIQWEFCLLTLAEIFPRKWMQHNCLSICTYSPPNAAFDKIYVSLELILNFFLPQTLCFWSGARQRSRTRAFTQWRSRWQLPLSRSLLWV